jgi:hypothetical protein
VKETPSDVVELIIAVDLNPSDPEEPINVNDVKVNPKGEGGEDGGEDWKKLTMQLLEAADIRCTSYEDCAEAVAEILQDDVEGESPFDQATKAPDKPKSSSLKLPHLMGGPSMEMDEDEDEE